MSIATTTAKVLSILSLCAVGAACDDLDDLDFDVGPYAAITYSGPAATEGSIDKIRDFDAHGRAEILSEGDFFQAIVTANVPEGEVMTVIDNYGGRTLSELPAGTVLHIQDDIGGMEDNALLDTMNIDLEDVTETEDTSVMLCGGDLDGEGEDNYWVDIPAEEAVIEVEATDDPTVNEVTVTAGVENPETGEIDVVTSSFNVNVAQ